MNIDEALVAMYDVQTLIRRECINRVPVLPREWQHCLARADAALPVIAAYVIQKALETTENAPRS